MYPRTKQEAAIANEDIKALVRVLYAIQAYNETSVVLAKTLKADGNKTLSFSKLLDMKDELLAVAQSIKSRTEIDDEELSSLGVSISVSIKFALASEVKSVSQDDIKMLRAFSAIFRAANPNALKHIEKFATVYGNGEIISSFVKESSDLPQQSEIESQLSPIVKKLTGKPGVIIPQEDVPSVKEKNPELFKEYMKLRRDFNSVWKAVLANMVRASGKKYLPYAQVVKAIEKQGIHHRLPKGFVGFIDDSNVLYTTAGKLINGFPTFDVKMNPKYDPATDDTYVFQMLRPDLNAGVGAYGYTRAYTRAARLKKYSVVQDSLHKIEPARKKWFTALKTQPETKMGVMGTVLELLYRFSARIGSVGNQTEGRSTFGMSTILVKHLKFEAGGVVIRYMGKAAGKGGAKPIPTIHKLKPISPIEKLLVRNLQEYCKGKEPNDRIFTYEAAGGKIKPVTGMDINIWFKTLMGSSEVHVHMLRHSVANQMFMELTENTKFKKGISQSELETQFKKMVTKIGGALGHRSGTKVTPMTALMSYIDPALSVAFFERMGYRTPKFLQKFTAQVSSVNTEELLEGE